MKNFVQPGESIEFTAPSGGVVSGRGTKIGDLVVIATVTAAEGARFNGLTEGVISHAKAPSQAWAEGDRLYWDEGNKRFTKTAGGNTFAGYSCGIVAGGAGDTTGVVLLSHGGDLQT